MRRTFAVISALALLAGALALPAGAEDLAMQSQPVGIHCPDHNSPDVEKIEDGAVSNDVVLPAGTVFCVKSGTSEDGNNTGPLVADGMTTLREYLALAGIVGGDGLGRDVSYYVVYERPPELEGILDVSKTAATSFTRTHDWSIEKSVEPTELWLYTDGSGDTEVEWTVEVTYEGYVDSLFAVEGLVTVSNTGDYAAAIASILDGALPITACTLVLDAEGAPADEPFVVGTDVLEPGAAIECAYTLPLAAKVDGENTVVVSGVFANQEPFSYPASASYAFGAPTTEVHRYVAVTDTNAGFALEYGAPMLDAHDYLAGESELFTYREEFTYAAYDACGDFTYENTARVIGDDEVVLDHATATLVVHVQCLVFKGETAWAANGDVPLVFRYAPKGNWATYVAYSGPKTTTLFAGQTIPVGIVTFGPIVDGEVLISVHLTGAWEFEDVAENLKIQDYATAPKGNPEPGLFAWKTTVAGGSTTASLSVPVNNFYGVHANVGRWIPDPTFGP